MEKQCAHPNCRCQAEAGKEFCSDACRNASGEGGACPCQHPGCKARRP